MKYFSVHPTDLETEEFLSASNDQIATWLMLHSFCSKQHNSGQISNAESLPPRFWMRHGIDLDVVKADSPLWKWEGSNVILDFYDLSGQELYIKKVEGGRLSRKGKSIKSPDKSPDKSPATYEKILEETEDKRERESSALSLSVLNSSDAMHGITHARQEWNLPFTKAEQEFYHHNRETIEAITPAEWETIRKYLAARLPEGSAGYQPHSKEKFIKDITDVRTHALGWERNQRRTAPKPTSRKPEQETEDTATPDDIRDWIASNTKITITHA